MRPCFEHEPFTNHENHIPFHVGSNATVTTRALEYWSYSTRWHHIFPRLSANLPRLTQFVYGHGYSFSARDDLTANLHHNAYVAFNGGIGPSPWLERNERYDGSRSGYGSVFDGNTGKNVLIWGPTVKEPGFGIAREEEEEDRHYTHGYAHEEAEDGDKAAEQDRSGCRVEDRKALEALLTVVAARPRKVGI